MYSNSNSTRSWFGQLIVTARCCAGLLWVATLFGLLADQVRAAGIPAFIPLGDLPGGTFTSSAFDVSADGAVVVGTSSGQSFRWTAGGGMVALGDGFAEGVSADGAVVVGYGNPDATVPQAYRWTAGGGMVGLGDLPGQDVDSFGNEVSADGAVVVGYGTPDSAFLEAFRWTAGDGIVGLGFLPGGFYESVATGTSADGEVVVGYSDSAFASREAFRWTAGGGMVGLGDLPGGVLGSVATAVSADGAVVVGDSGSSNASSGTSEAFRWTADGGMVGLGGLTEGPLISHAYAVSADGAVVVGTSSTALGTKAFRWTEANGMQSIEDILTDAGLGASIEGWDLKSARSVSADGRTIVGSGTNPDGFTEAWLAVVPEPSSFVLVITGVVGFFAAATLRHTMQRNRNPGAIRPVH